MSNRRKVVSAAFTGVAATGIAGFAAGPAPAAAGSWSVNGGGPVTLHNNAPDVFTEHATGHEITCAASTVNLTGTLNSGVVGNPVGTINASGTIGTAASPCTGAGGFLVVKGHVQAAMQYSASSQPFGRSSIVFGKVTGVSVRADSTFADVCAFTATGSVSGSYNDMTGVLTAIPTPTLHVSVVAGKNCAGLVNTSDSASWAGPLTVTNAGGGHPVINHV